MIASQDPFQYSAFQGDRPSEEPPESSTVAMLRQGRLLVVDDELAICNSLRRLFSRHTTVSTMTSAPKALEVFRAGERFDVVLCDLMMPEMGGIDLYVEVNRLAQEQAARFVFMSGASLSAQVSAFLSTIPNTMLVKPFDMPRLTDLVKERLRA